MKKKILLFTGNHHSSNVGIVDYIETLRLLLNNSEYILVKSNQIHNLFIREFHAVIVIEEFSTTLKVNLMSLFLRRFKGKKILILTEFINEKNKTLNSFDNILQNEYSFYFKIKKIVNFLSKNFIFALIFFISSKLIEWFKTIRGFIFQKIPGFSFRAIILLLSLIFLPVIHFFKQPGTITQYLRYTAVKYRKIRFIGENYWKKFLRLGKTEKDFDRYKEEIYMKARYLGLINVINFFDIILTSHDNILPVSLLNKEILTKRIYFDIVNDEVEINSEKKIQLSFSGYLNKYRLDVLKTLCKDKNKFFDYNEIEEIIKYSKPRFIKKKYVGKNICSIHVKKSKEWPFSSPTRYLNSINKNEIPLILEDFEDEESKLLTLKKESLYINNWQEFKKEIEELNKKIKDYKILLNNNKHSIKKLL